MSELLEKHPVKTQVATIVVAILFVIGATRVLTQDRDAAYSQIAANEAALLIQKETNKKLADEVCKLREEMRAADVKLTQKDHENELAYTEIKTKLIGVEALLVKIDKKMDRK